MTDIPSQNADSDPATRQAARHLLSTSAFRLRRRSGFEGGKRLIFLSILVLLMLIPLDMVEGVVQERADRKHQVETEIGEQWGPEQTVGGPILVIPYQQTETQLKADGSSEQRLVRHYASFLPAETKMTAKATVEKRHKSIYEILVYGTDVTLTGHFS